MLYLLVSAFFIPFGSICLRASKEVKELRMRYDDKDICTNNATNNQERSEKVTQEDEGINCHIKVTLKIDLKPPVYVYYELTDYFQNHRRYVKSRSDEQLANKGGGHTSACKPKLYAESDDTSTESSEDDSRIIKPCGLAAWSFFNDTFTVNSRNPDDDLMTEKGIAWKTDIKYKFGDYKPENFNDDTSKRGGGNITESVSEDEHFIVWMRTASAPCFRKLYGIITKELKANEELTFTIKNRYNTYQFGGRKSIILSTTSWLGGHSNFLGSLQLTIGCTTFFVGLVYFLLHIRYPRTIGDSRFLSWVQ